MKLIYLVFLTFFLYTINIPRGEGLIHIVLI